MSAISFDFFEAESKHLIIIFVNFLFFNTLTPSTVVPPGEETRSTKALGEIPVTFKYSTAPIIVSNTSCLAKDEERPLEPAYTSWAAMYSARKAGPEPLIAVI